jgi:chromosome segregation ATPase
MLEQMTPEIEQEKKDAVDAKDFLEMLEKTYAEAGGKLRQGRSELERARRDMARAGQQRTVAEQQAEAARRAAGLTSATSSMTVALKAMHEAATAKAKLLRPTQPEHDDPNIAAALAAVSGKSPTPQSLSDRLAALKSRGGG